jgi:WhiB family transcriptional regulator, redox-sensing transcriptional regulator
MGTRSDYGLSTQIGGDWRHRSVCRNQDPELFFPIGSTGPALLQIEQAKNVCRRCPVATDCLQWALDTNQEAGVWGGYSEKERRAIKRRGGRLPAERLARKTQRRPVIERWMEYRDSGLPTKAIARQLGVDPKGLYKALERARKAGDPRVAAKQAQAVAA